MCDPSLEDFSINNVNHEKLGFKKIQDLYEQKKFCDMYISGQSKTFQVHACIMVGFSKYIETEANRMNENGERITIKLSNVNDEILAKIIDYCYSGVLNVNAANVLDITDASGFLQMDHLLQESEKLSRSYLNVNNCFTLLNIAEKYHLEELKTFVKEYIDFNFIQIYNTSEFLNIEYEKLLELVKSENLNVTKELDVFECVKIWILHDENNRKDSLNNLLDCVKFPLLTGKELFKKARKFCSDRNCIDYVLDALEIKMTPESTKPKPRNLGSVILIFGDRNENVSSKSMIYDPTKDQWFEYVDFEISDLINFKTAVLKDSLVVLGGVMGKEIYRKIVINYDMKKNGKLGFPSMIHKRYRPGLAVIDDVLFVAGGFDGRFVLDNAEKYDTRTRKWNLITETMLSKRKDCVGIAFMNEMFVIGGNDGSSSLKTVEAYCPNTNKWRSVESMNEARENASAAIIGNFIYVVGGSQSDKYLKTVEKYDPISNIWTLVSEISTPRHGIGLCAVGSDLYAIGGVNESGTLSIIEKFDTSNPAGTWNKTETTHKRGNCTAIAFSKPLLKRLKPDVIKD